MCNLLYNSIFRFLPRTLATDFPSGANRHTKQTLLQVGVQNGTASSPSQAAKFSPSVDGAVLPSDSCQE